MHRLVIALLVCLVPSAAYADAILLANCAVTPALCSATPTLSGNILLEALDYKGQVDEGYSFYNVTNASYTLYDATYRTSVSAAITVGYDGIHGSSGMAGGGSADGDFGGEIIDYFQATGSIPKGAQIEVTYGADMLSNTLVATRNGDYSATLSLNSVDCFSGYHYGNFSDSCTAYVPFNPNTGIAELDLNFFADLEGTNVFLDATNTAKFQAITLVDSSGNPLTGVQLYDASGHNYDAAVPPTTTPEPSSLLLLTTGLATMTGLARRRMSRR